MVDLIARNSLDSQNNHMFNSQLRKQFSQFHYQDAGGSSRSSGNHKRVTPQSDLGARRRRRKRRGTSQASHLLPEAISRYAPQTYDAVWAIALALRAAEEHWRKDAAQSKLDGFDYTRSDMAWEFLQQLGKLHFLGVSVSSVCGGVVEGRSSRAWITLAMLAGPRLLQRSRSRWHHCLLSDPARPAGTRRPLLSGHRRSGLPLPALSSGQVAQWAGAHREACV